MGRDVIGCNEWHLVGLVILGRGVKGFQWKLGGAHMFYEAARTKVK
jgi:hypothetical protein